MKFMRSALAAALIFSCVALSAETNPFGVTNPFEIGGTGGGGGGITKFFGSAAERDAYFQTNDRELRNGVTAAIGDPAVIYMWNGTAWVEAANTFIGAKGDTGAQGIQGIPGNDGADGAAATLTIGTVNTLAPTEAATVENIGTDTDAVLVLGIPQGMRGQQGERGLTGEAAVANVRYRGEWVSTDEYLLNDIAVGSDGSAYVALATSTGVEPSTDTTGAWALFVSQGPSGEDGIDGADGQKGDRGLTGLPGPIGPIGPKGNNGALQLAVPSYTDTKILVAYDDIVGLLIRSSWDINQWNQGNIYTMQEDGFIQLSFRCFLNASAPIRNLPQMRIIVNGKWTPTIPTNWAWPEYNGTSSTVEVNILTPYYPVKRGDQVRFTIYNTEPTITSITGMYDDSGLYFTPISNVIESMVLDFATSSDLSATETSLVNSFTQSDGLLSDRITALEDGGGTGTETDPVYTDDKAGTMHLGDVEIAGSLTLGQPPLSPAEATNKAYVDSAIGAATQDVADNYAVKPDSRSGYVMPPQVFDYADSNTFTVDAAPKFVLEAMILRPDSFTYMQQSDISFSGTAVTLNNVTINSGDKVKITYAIQ